MKSVAPLLPVCLLLVLVGDRVTGQCGRGEAALGAPAVTKVPHGIVPLFDGRVGKREYSDALHLKSTKGGMIFLKHTQSRLHIGIRAKAPGLAHVAIWQGKRVAILHASASLGCAVFEKDGKSWRLKQGFKWECRNASDSEKAQLERDDYYQTHGWVGSVTNLGPGNEVEFEIAKKRLKGARIAIVFYPMGQPRETFWFPPKLDDSSRDEALLCGKAPSTPRFVPEEWATLKFVEGRKKG